MNTTEKAQARASISAYLSNNPGQRSTEDVATAIGISARTAGQMLGAMSRGKLIRFNGKAGKAKRWSWPVVAGTDVQPSPEKHSKRTTTTAPKELELVIDGLQIVVGKNPATGRLRIVIEEQ